jgi:hypothetical protein
MSFTFKINEVPLLSALDDYFVVPLRLEHTQFNEVELLGREPAQLLAVGLAQSS